MVYLEVTSDVDDALIGVDVPVDVAARTELHTSNADGGGGAHQHSSDGTDIVTMKQVVDIVVPAGATVELRPGGNHVMLVDLPRRLAVGDTFDATLRFASERTLHIEVIVADNPP